MPWEMQILFSLALLKPKPNYSIWENPIFLLFSLFPSDCSLNIPQRVLFWFFFLMVIFCLNNSIKKLILTMS